MRCAVFISRRNKTLVGLRKGCFVFQKIKFQQKPNAKTVLSVKRFPITIETSMGGVGLFQRFEIVPDSNLIHTRNRGF